MIGNNAGQKERDKTRDRPAMKFFYDVQITQIKAAGKYQFNYRTKSLWFCWRDHCRSPRKYMTEDEKLMHP